MLLLDEPCSALDPLATGKIEDSGTLSIGGAASFKTQNDTAQNITLDVVTSTFGAVTVQSLKTDFEFRLLSAQHGQRVGRQTEIVKYDYHRHVQQRAERAVVVDRPCGARRGAT